MNNTSVYAQSCPITHQWQQPFKSLCASCGKLFSHSSSWRQRLIWVIVCVYAFNWSITSEKVDCRSELWYPPSSTSPSRLSFSSLAEVPRWMSQHYSARGLNREMSLPSHYVSLWVGTAVTCMYSLKEHRHNIHCPVVIYHLISSLSSVHHRHSHKSVTIDSEVCCLFIDWRPDGEHTWHPF